MKKGDVEIGMRVMQTSMPMKGRIGTVIGQKRSMIGTLFEVRFDHADWAGRTVIELHPKEMRPYTDPE